jgi:hypothetical protein
MEGSFENPRFLEREKGFLFMNFFLGPRDWANTGAGSTGESLLSQRAHLLVEKLNP